VSGCDAELCENWAGFGCVCEALDLPRPIMTDCGDCGCSDEDHDAAFFGGGCTSCGDCEGYR